MTLPPLLRSASFRLTLIYVLLFGGSAAVLLGFIYWATAGTLSDQVDATIEADIKGLAEQYELRGTPGVAAIISERVRQDPGGRTVYLLTDPLRRPLVGNLSDWFRSSISFSCAARRSNSSSVPRVGIRRSSAPSAISRLV